MPAAKTGWHYLLAIVPTTSVAHLATNKPQIELYSVSNTWQFAGYVIAMHLCDVFEGGWLKKPRTLRKSSIAASRIASSSHCDVKCSKSASLC
jgi:hypothetical protein